MNPRTTYYVQAIRGPVLLVTVGVLFAIHQAGVLSFSRTWPLLVIVIGVMKLLERAGAPNLPGGPVGGAWAGGAPPPYQGGYRTAGPTYTPPDVPPQGPGAAKP
jgi:hypothetical protein